MSHDVAESLAEELALGMVLGYDGEPSVTDTERLMARAASALRELARVSGAARETGATVYLDGEWDFETSMDNQRRHKANDAEYIGMRCLDEDDVENESYTCEHPGCGDSPAVWALKDAGYRTDSSSGFHHYRCRYHVPKYLAYDAGFED